MDFYTILEVVEEGHAYNPFAGKIKDEQWVEGTISINFLNTNFGQYTTAQAMIDATESEGLKLYFQRLKNEGLLN